LGKKLVSIIIPAYNAEKYLNECIDSVLRQTMKDIEVIIVNDGSGDNTSEILKHYESLDPRVKVINQVNQGQGTARNSGLNIAGGDAIMFLDSDDYYTEEVVETAYSALKNNHCEIVIFNGSTFWDDDVAITLGKEKYFSLGSEDVNVIRTGVDFLKLTKGRIQSPCLKIYSREFIDKHKIRFLDGGFGEDTYFFYYAFILAERVCYVDYIGYSRRYRTDSTMTSTGVLNIESRIKHFPLLISLLDKLDNGEYRSLVMKQYVYYACLLWIMIHNRCNVTERCELRSMCNEYGLVRIVSENRSDIVTCFFSVFMLLPNFAEAVNIVIAKTARRLLRGKTRFAI